jgi:integrase-like protein
VLRSRAGYAMGMGDKPIAQGWPWQNGFVERLIGTIRRECVDHIVALDEQHLRRFIKSYASYYNTARTHRSLAKDAPVSRPVQRIGRIVSNALVGVLHYQRPNLSFRDTQSRPPTAMAT